MQRTGKKRTARWAATLGLVVGFAVPTASAETLADALVGAYQNSGLIDQNRALLRAADEDVALALGEVHRQEVVAVDDDVAEMSSSDVVGTTVDLLAGLASGGRALEFLHAGVHDDRGFREL